MSFAPATFRQIFPEFADPIKAPDVKLNLLSQEALLEMDAVQWGTWLDVGCNYLTAHKLAVGLRRLKEARGGGVPGMVQGPLASKAVGEASASFDNSEVVVKGGGILNTTVYGLEFLRLQRMIGAGPLQVC